MVELLSPSMDETVMLLPDGQRMLRAGTVPSATRPDLDWRSPTQGGEDRSFPLPVRFAWRGTGMVADRLLIGTTPDLASARAYPCGEKDAEVYNLLIGQTYYWKLVLHGEDGTPAESPVGRFVTGNLAPRLICAEGLTNVRDVGGWPILEGRHIRQGMIYRGSEMDTHYMLTEHAYHVLRDELGVRTDLDLRGEAVERIDTSPLGADVRFELIPVCAYGEFFERGQYDACRAVFSVLADPDAWPIYVHCWGGADRTGTVILLLQALLGMEDELLLQDYEMTSFTGSPRLRSSELFKSLLDALNRFGVPEEALAVKARRFLRDTGLTDALLDRLCDNLLL